MNDLNHVSEPKVELYVQYPIEFIQVDVMLGYKDATFNKTARVERMRKDTSLPQKYESVTSLTFDSVHKQYSYCFLNPEPGFFYRIVWER